MTRLMYPPRGWANSIGWQDGGAAPTLGTGGDNRSAQKIMAAKRQRMEKAIERRWALQRLEAYVPKTGPELEALAEGGDQDAHIEVVRRKLYRTLRKFGGVWAKRETAYYLASIFVLDGNEALVQAVRDIAAEQLQTPSG